MIRIVNVHGVVATVDEKTAATLPADWKRQGSVQDNSEEKAASQESGQSPEKDKNAPSKTATAKEWREYAASRGIETGNMNREELIAAVEAL